MTWKEETERAEETERKTRGMEGEEERAKRERCRSREMEEGRQRNPGIDKDER